MHQYGCDASHLQFDVVLEQIANRCVTVAHVVNPDSALPVRFSSIRLEQLQIGERKAMVLIVVRQKRESRVLKLDLGTKDGLIPLQHFVKTARAVDHVREFDRTDNCHVFFSQLASRVSQDSSILAAQTHSAVNQS